MTALQIHHLTLTFEHRLIIAVVAIPVLIFLFWALKQLMLPPGGRIK